MFSVASWALYRRRGSRYACPLCPTMPLRGVMTAIIRGLVVMSIAFGAVYRVFDSLSIAPTCIVMTPMPAGMPFSVAWLCEWIAVCLYVCVRCIQILGRITCLDCSPLRSQRSLLWVPEPGDWMTNGCLVVHDSPCASPVVGSTPVLKIALPSSPLPEHRSDRRHHSIAYPRLGHSLLTFLGFSVPSRPFN